MTNRYVPFIVVALLFAGVGTATAQQDNPILEPAKDNTLFEDNEGTLSNGVGSYIFVGRTNQGTLRRALLAFDLTDAIPDGATLDSVRLTLEMNRTISGPQPVSLHRVTSDWGEGASDAEFEEGGGIAATSGDATWLHTFFDTEMWSQPGGDFVGDASATTQVDGNGVYTWSTAGMTADVQAWMDASAPNFGWILIGNEGDDGSAKRFSSREGPTPPTLTLFFASDTATEDADEIPDAVRLAPNFPNPFRTATTISYELEAPQPVTLAVFDALGRRVATLVDGVQSAGPHEVTFDAEGLTPGIYICRLDAGATRHHRTMILLP